jgi:hypothetical protein
MPRCSRMWRTTSDRSRCPEASLLNETRHTHRNARFTSSQAVAQPRESLSGAAYIHSRLGHGAGLVRPNDYTPPRGVALKPWPSWLRAHDGSARCRVLEANNVPRCGWSPECAKEGACSTARGGGCQAATDDDCEQSIACLDDGRCTARDGACVAG